MTVESQPNDLSTQVKESLAWVTTELMGEYGLYVDKKEVKSRKTGMVFIDHVHIFNNKVERTIMSIDSTIAKSIVSMDVWVRDEYLNLNSEQKFLTFAFLGREIVNNDYWNEIGLGYVSRLSEGDVQEVDYFFRNILNPQSDVFISYLKAYERIFLANKTLRKAMSGLEETENLLSEFRKPS